MEIYQFSVVYLYYHIPKKGQIEFRLITPSKKEKSLIFQALTNVS